MNRLLRIAMSVVLGAAVLTSLAGRQALAADTTPQPGTAVVSELENTVYMRTSTEAGENLASNGDVVPEGGVVRTGALSSVRLDFSDGTIVRIKETSTFTITSAAQTGNPLVALTTAVGKLWLILNGQQATVTTPMGVASVRGSMMGMSYNPAMGEIKVTCLETAFTCTVTLAGVSYELQPGSMLSAPPYSTPRIEPIDVGELQEFLRYNPEAAPFIDDLPYIDLDQVIVKDQDGDGVPDQFDNCPNQFNSDQLDTFGDDGVGNACTPNQTPDEPEPTTTEDPCESEETYSEIRSELPEECYEEEGPVGVVVNSLYLG
jgi:FecR protein